MSQLTVTSSYLKPQNADKNEEEEEAAKDEIRKLRENELSWVQEKRVVMLIDESLENLKHCCAKLNLGSKCDERLQIPVLQTTTEKYSLTPRQGAQDTLKASVTLLDDNVIQAEVSIKYPKAGGGYFRAVAQPDVQWKLQQLQDLGNYISRVTIAFCDLKDQLTHMSVYTNDSGKRVLEDLRQIKNELCLARASIQLPRKRSLLELCYFPPTRKFVPQLPQDQLLSFYISSCRLVCASYQMVPKTVHPQGLSVFMAECRLPYLDEILRRLNHTMNSVQRLIGYIEIYQN
ncbi:unnamed protein product [Caenorhabditis angaria]|uniref:Protein rogdi homolog n=1 Tax=Caenorhabditis angaria TaxID=860376 RepID=A0A9P1MYK2_9PELO|nr:unnamed protein product [Caenorhabditis angaria]